VQNPLWRRAKAVPSLDLRFADSKSLVDATTGSNLVTFTRASSGTFVGSDGLIQTAVTNLLLRSEEFETTWGPTNATISANAITAPNGTLTADKLVETVDTGVHAVTQGPVTSGLAYVFSVYAKAGERTRMQLSGMGAEGQGFFTDYNLSTGVVSSAPSGSQMIAVGDDWYRCTLVITASATGGPIIRMRGASGSNNYTGDGTSGLFLWGAQLEQSSTVGEYIPTTSTINSAPRFDHNPTTGESLGLLVEESRTNLQTQSEAFDQSPWSTVGGTTSTNVIAAPDSTTTADLLTEKTTTGQHDIRATSPSLTDAVSYTFSVFAKTNGRLLQIIFPITASGHGGVFNLTAGTVTVVGTVTATIQAFPNGWYRCIVSGVKSGSGTVTSRLLTYNGTTNNYTGDGTSGIYIWGAQLEAAAFPTSYIPTTTATVTRSADVASISGSNFSSWYRQDEGTLFTDTVNRETYPGTNVFPYILQIDDSTNNNRISYDNSVLGGGYRYNLPCLSGGVSQGELSQFGFASGAARWASAFRTNDFALAINLSPSVVSTRTSGTLPNVMTQLRIGSGFGKQFTGTIKRLTYWPQRLPNSTLQAVTQ
jgi:hypothetical protein